MYLLHGVTVTINHRVMNSDGDYSITGSYQLAGCGYSPLTHRSYATETFEELSTRADIILYAPPDADVRDTDSVTLDDGTVWLVWGRTATFVSPFTGWRAGMQVPLRRYTG